MRRASLLTVSAGWLVGLVLVVGCGGDAMAPQLALVPPPSFAFSDGAHSGGTPHFFFLPPIVSTLPPVTGSFDGTLTHYRRSIFGRCLTYSATISGSMTLTL